MSEKAEDLLSQADALMRRHRVFIAGGERAQPAEEDLPVLEEVVSDAEIRGIEERIEQELRSRLEVEYAERLEAELPERVERELERCLPDEIAEGVEQALPARVAEEIATRLPAELERRI
ncbi:MAG: hypothetical protein COZ38_11575, partial [Rhodocyclales bacterium CG_4_10_14_3_um_filter_68_10]